MWQRDSSQWRPVGVAGSRVYAFTHTSLHAHSPTRIHWTYASRIHARTLIERGIGEARLPATWEPVWAVMYPEGEGSEAVWDRGRSAGGGRGGGKHKDKYMHIQSYSTTRLAESFYAQPSSIVEAIATLPQSIERLQSNYYIFVLNKRSCCRKCKSSIVCTQNTWFIDAFLSALFLVDDLRLLIFSTFKEEFLDLCSSSRKSGFCWAALKCF